ncbi:MAG: GNAT family N-acetyltransferase [Alphaproteobacteria bacterium]|jgi:ribosomal protein S18 acetylase RimI-like enzyme
MDVKLVPADDNPALALAAAHLLWDSSAHFLGYLYDGDQSRGFEDLRFHWLRPGGLLSHRHAFLATGTSDNEIHGLALAMGGDQKRGEAELTGQHMAALATERVIPDFFERLEALNEFHPEVPGQALYLQNIAVRGTERGKGLGDRLFHTMVELAREGGYGALHLDVVSDNPAVSFYRRHGMEILTETDVRELREKHGQPSRYRMVMDIPAAD